MKLTYPQEEVEVLDELEGDDALERDALVMVCDVRVRGGVLELDALEEDLLVHDELVHGGALELNALEEDALEHGDEQEHDELEHGGAQEHGEL